MHSSFLVLSGLIAVATAFPYELHSGLETSIYKQVCISASSVENGAPVTIHDCATEDASKHQWIFSLDSKFPVGPQHFRLQGTEKCLDVKDGNNADGAKLQIWDCDSGGPNSNQLFNYHDFQWGTSGKCIDVPNGDTSDGNQLQLWTCSGGPNQSWNRWDSGRSPISPAVFEARNGPVVDGACMTAESNNDGAGVVIAPCFTFDQFPNGNRTWFYPDANPGLSGPFKTFDGTKCLDLKDGSMDNGASLQIWTCSEGNPNQQFAYSGFKLRPAGSNKCLDVTDSNYNAGSKVQLWDCAGGDQESSGSQAWLRFAPSRGN